MIKWLSKSSFSEYSKVLSNILNLNLYSAKKSNLNNITKFSNYMGNPHLSYNTIHITGTNGKGSVTTKISSILSHSGYKVGTFTSPHISSFRERIKINNQKINKQELVYIYKQIHHSAKKIGIFLTFFEFITIMAFTLFKEKQIDFGVIEVGIGGDLDATNIIKPDISIVTSIGLDHAKYLGNTLREISIHKAGVIKYKTPCVLGYDVPTRDIFINKAKEMETKCYQLSKKGKTYDEDNSNTSHLAINVLKMLNADKYNKVSDRSIEIGLKEKPICRMERVFENLPNKKKLFKGRIEEIFLDAGHNPHAFRRLLRDINYVNVNKRPIRIICAFSREKDVKNILKLLSMEKNLKVNFLSVSHSRLFSYKELVDFSKGFPIEIFEDLSNKSNTKGNLQSILSQCKNNEIVLICGSFFIMKEVRLTLGYSDEIDSFELNEAFIPKLI